VADPAPALRTAVRQLGLAAATRSRRRQRSHGRAESRSIKVIDYDGTGIPEPFPGARRAIRVVRQRCTADGRRSVETV
jgi:hypothetical protein